MEVARLVQATAQAPITGIFADPVVATLLRILSIILSLALSGTIILACIKMIAYFGGQQQRQLTLETAVRDAGSELKGFAAEVREVLKEYGEAIVSLKGNDGDHERRLLESERRMSDMERRHFERRSIDRND